VLSLRLAAVRQSGDNVIGPHHVVGSMFEDVAVIEIAAEVAFETHNNAGNNARRALQHILPSQFMRGRRVGISGQQSLIGADEVERHLSAQVKAKQNGPHASSNSCVIP
jgi:hypothetical protein